MKIVAVVGPPNSGKTVLLMALFYKKGYYIVQAQPDGEGSMWLTQSAKEISEKFRKSNKFKENMNDPAYWAKICRQISALKKNESHLYSIPVLNMGGKPNEDKVRILKAANAQVIMLLREDQFHEAYSEWLRITEKANAQVIGIIKSKKQGISKVVKIAHNFFQAEIASLERGKERELSENPVVTELDLFLKRLIGLPEPKLLEQHDNKTIIRVDLILNRLYDKNYNYEVKDTEKILNYIAKQIENLQKEIVLSGRLPNFLVTTLTLRLSENYQVYIEDPKEERLYVKIQPYPVTSNPSNNFKVYRLHNSLKAQILNLNPYNKILNPDDAITFPEPEGKEGIILFGKAPLWLYARAALTYKQKVPFIGIAQPHIYGGHPGYTVVYPEKSELLYKVFPLETESGF